MTENVTTLEYRTFGSFERDSYKPFFTMTYQSGITLSQSSATVYKGETIELTATTAPAGQAVTWASDAPTVASVDENGVVTGLSTGNAIITAELEDETIAACTIEVLAKIIDFRYNTNTEVYKGNTVTLMPYTEPADEPVTWTSLDPDVATVSNGLVTGVSPGNAVIRAFLRDDTYADCEVTVLATNIFFECVCDSECAEDCTCGCTSINLYVEETVTLTATTVPPGMPVTWESLDPTIATVVDGVVTGISAGETKIRARLDEYTFAECTVNIRAWQINWDESSIKIAVGDSYTFMATTTPLGKHITWSSSDTTIATISQSGEVNTLKFGDVIITATLADGTSESCVVKVRYRGSFLFSQIDLIDGEGELLLLYTEEPIEITWTSSNSNIATVNENGYVQSKNPGVVRITANSPDLLQPVTCEVNVRLMRSMYSLKNMNSNLQMAAKNYGIFEGTNVVQQASASAHVAEAYSKIWKIYYLENGYYSIRPAHKLDLCLYTDGNRVYLTNNSAAQDSSSLTNYAQWSITVTPAGDLIIKNRVYSNDVLMPSGGSTAANAILMCGSIQGSSSTYTWRYSGMTVEPRILLYNSSTGKYRENLRKGMVPEDPENPKDEEFTLADLEITTAVVSNTSNDQSWVQWLPIDEEEIARVHSQTGTVTVTGTYGEAVVTAMKEIDGDFRYASYTVVVSKIRITGYERDYEPERWNYDPVKYSTNCYAYSINSQFDPLKNNFGCNYIEVSDDNNNILQQPGDIYNNNNSSGSKVSPLNSSGAYSVDTVLDAVQKDFEVFNALCGRMSIIINPNITEIPPEAYMVYLAIMPGGPGFPGDYHWYRQNPDGTWSHKQGIDSVINTVSKKNNSIIWNPENAAQQIGYTTNGGYFAIIPWNLYYDAADANQLHIEPSETTVHYVEQSELGWINQESIKVPMHKTVDLDECDGIYESVAKSVVYAVGNNLFFLNGHLPPKKALCGTK